MRLCLVVWAFALFLSLCSFRSIGQPVYFLSDSSVTHRIDNVVSFLVDSANTATIREVSSSDFTTKFHASHGNLRFGYLKPNLWLKIQIKTATPSTHWLLEIPAPYLEYVDFYQGMPNGSWHHSRAGYYVKQSSRVKSHTNHLVPLRFLPDSATTVYIKIAGRSPKTFPIFIVEETQLNAKTRYEDIGYGLFFGILLVMFFYNLLLFVTLKQTNYLLYICTIVCTFLIFAAASGYGGKFLWPETPEMNFYAGRLTLGIMIIFLSIFTIRFLEVKKYSDTLYYLLASLVPLGIIAFMLVVTETLSSAGNNLVTLSTVLFLITGIYCRIKGNKTATYFIAAWTFYLIGGLLLTLRNSGVLDYTFWTTHFVEIGAALETTIIAFALGDRYRRYKQEKEEIQLLALKVQQEATERLEMKVMERTEELSKANLELQAMLEKNQLQTQIIENKNAELDSFFYRISHDLKGPIASMLGLSALAKRDIQDSSARAYLDKQHMQAERLNNIISGLIELTKLNDTTLHKEQIDFHKLIDECIQSLQDLPEFSRISFHKKIQPGLVFYCEWTLLNAIIQNLLENAIKYSSREGAFVEITVSSDDYHLTICVADNGHGISEEHQSKIFDMFYRANHHSKGTGLGLYILKRSVDRLRGKISIESRLGAGSRFTVKLPR
ncbi:MAG TPA: sensor histidine kinase [Chryseosolibacter sp.]